MISRGVDASLTRQVFLLCTCEVIFRAGVNFTSQPTYLMKDMKSGNVLLNSGVSAVAIKMAGCSRPYFEVEHVHTFSQPCAQLSRIGM